jgi:hypothetical protein
MLHSDDEERKKENGEKGNYGGTELGTVKSLTYQL